MSAARFYLSRFVFASLTFATCNYCIAYAQNTPPSDTLSQAHASSSLSSALDSTTVYSAPIFTGGVAKNATATNVNSSNVNSSNKLAKFASGSGNAIFLGVGTLLPLLEDGPEGKKHALRTVDSLLTSTLITEALKQVTHEKRPDGSDYESFPSGHATAAFAVATMQSHYHPKQAPFWYAGAALISYSRVKLDRHYYHDVIAGAAVGYLTSRWELSQPRGLILAPFIGSHKAGGGGGMSLSMNF